MTSILIYVVKSHWLNLKFVFGLDFCHQLYFACHYLSNYPGFIGKYNWVSCCICWPSKDHNGCRMNSPFLDVSAIWFSWIYHWWWWHAIRFLKLSICKIFCCREWKIDLTGLFQQQGEFSFRQQLQLLIFRNVIWSC